MKNSNAPRHSFAHASQSPDAAAICSISPNPIPCAKAIFSDRHGVAARMPHTVARGDLEDDASGYTADRHKSCHYSLPIPVTREILERGQQRFEINCVPCHGKTGEGNGIVVQRGFPAPPSYHIERLRAAPVGHFFDVMTRGYGVMLSAGRARHAGRPLGDRRLHSRAAIEPKRQDRRRPPTEIAKLNATAMNEISFQNKIVRKKSVLPSGILFLILCALAFVQSARIFHFVSGRVYFLDRPALGCFNAAMIHYLTGGRLGKRHAPFSRSRIHDVAAHGDFFYSDSFWPARIISLGASRIACRRQNSATKSSLRKFLPAF